MQKRCKNRHRYSKFDRFSVYKFASRGWYKIRTQQKLKSTYISFDCKPYRSDNDAACLCQRPNCPVRLFNEHCVAANAGNQQNRPFVRFAGCARTLAARCFCFFFCVLFFSSLVRVFRPNSKDAALSVGTTFLLKQFFLCCYSLGQLAFSAQRDCDDDFWTPNFLTALFFPNSTKCWMEQSTVLWLRWRGSSK